MHVIFHYSRSCLRAGKRWPAAIKIFVVGSTMALCLVGGALPLCWASESSVTLSLQVDLAKEFQNFDWTQSHIMVSLLDDRQDLSKLLTEWQEASKGQLEPLVKDYMYTAELLTRLAQRQENMEERERVLQVFYEREKQIQDILNGYSARIDNIFQEQTLQVRKEAGQSVMRIDFREIPPGKYRAYVVVTLGTTAFQWFEAFNLKGGDAALRVLTREKLNNPYWTELNWWKFMNLDFSKHH